MVKKWKNTLRQTAKNRGFRTACRRGWSLLLCLTILLSPVAVISADERENQPDLVISTVQELRDFADRVNKGEDFSGKMVVLANDINLLADDESGSDIGGDTGGNTGSDTGSDIGGDTGSDTGGNTGGNTGSDIGGDTGSDIGGDIGSDTGSNIGGDTGGDTGSDIGGDTDSDTGSNIGGDTGSDTGSNIGSGTGDDEPEPAPEPDEKLWIPIGTMENPFQGIFDGQGYTVSGLMIDTEENYQGLFGYVKGAAIRNVTVDGAVTGGSYVGGVVGYVNSNPYICTISGCVNNAQVSGNDCVGGIVGALYWDGGLVNACVNAGAVRGTSRIGGIIGGFDNAYDSKVSVCCNLGAVSGSGGMAGGIVGNQDSGCDNVVTSSYNAGSVSGFTVGAIGAVGFEKNGGCYYLEGTVTAPADGEQVTPVTETQCGSGELAWLLNTSGGTATNSGTWGQRDGFPAPAGEAAPVIGRVTIEHNTGAGVITCEKEYIPAGELVTLAYNRDQLGNHQAMSGLTAVDSKSNTVPLTKEADDSRTFTMPADDVAVTVRLVTYSTSDVWSVVLVGNGGYFGTENVTTYRITCHGGDSLKDLISSPAALELVYGNETEDMHYLVAGWYTDINNPDEFYDLDTIVYGNLILYAKWQLQTEVTVNFDLNLGSSSAGHSQTPEPQTGLSGTRIQNPGDPSCEYESIGSDGVTMERTFLGWFTDPTEGQKWDFDESTLPADGSTALTLYAHWDIQYDFGNTTGVTITDEEMLKAMAGVDNGTGFAGYTFVLEADLELTESVVIGGEGNTFNGAFLGNDHTITLAENQSQSGLFGSLGETAVVNGLNLVANINVNYSPACALAEINNGTIQNCSLGEGSVISASNGVGGLVVSNSGTIDGCWVEGAALYSAGSVGGIAATNSGTISNCVSRADRLGVKSENVITSYECFSGGIAGESIDGSVIRNCVNDTPIISGTEIGGIVGTVTGAGVENCYNAVDLTYSVEDMPSKGFVSFWGGIAGQLEDGTIRQCYNSADMIQPEDDTGVVTVGGIVGSVVAQGNTIEDCYFAGNVISEDTLIRSGGILGAQETYLMGKGNVAIRNCYWLGSTLAGKAAGALVSVMSDMSDWSDTVTVSDCYYGLVGYDDSEVEDVVSQAGLHESVYEDGTRLVRLKEAEFSGGYAAWLLDGGTEHRGVWTMNIDVQEETGGEGTEEEASGAGESGVEKSSEESGAGSFTITETVTTRPVLGEGSIYRLTAHLIEEDKSGYGVAASHTDWLELTVGGTSQMWRGDEEAFSIYVSGGVPVQWRVSGMDFFNRLNRMAIELSEEAGIEDYYWPVLSYNMTLRDANGKTLYYNEEDGSASNVTLCYGTLDLKQDKTDEKENGTYKLDRDLEFEWNYWGIVICELPEKTQPENVSKPESGTAGGGKGAGSGNGIGSGSGSGSNGSGSDGSGAADRQENSEGTVGTGEKTTVEEIVIAAPSEESSAEPVEELPVQNAEVAEVTQIEDAPMDETQSEDIQPDERPEGGSPVADEAEPPEEEEPEEPQEPVVLEVVMDTVKENPFTTVLVGLMILGVIILGALRRVRKAKQEA